MALQIKRILLTDGTELDASALAYVSVTSKGNLQVTTPAGGKLNIEASDNIAFKPNGKVQLDTNHYADPANMDEFKISVIKDKGSVLEGLKIECAGVKFVTSGADTNYGWNADLFKLMFKKTTGSAGDTWAKLNMHAASVDIRTRTTGKGTGGGIALQISSCDSRLKENKLKLETDRKKDWSEGVPTSDSQYTDFYTGEGGKGIEIGTVNSQFESVYTATMRRGADTRVYATTRGEVKTYDSNGVETTTAANIAKYDYPTQADDSKDILCEHLEVTWRDIINAAAYLKKNGSIPATGFIK